MEQIGGSADITAIGVTSLSYNCKVDALDGHAPLGRGHHPWLCSYASSKEDWWFTANCLSNTIRLSSRKQTRTLGIQCIPVDGLWAKPAGLRVKINIQRIRKAETPTVDLAHGLSGGVRNQTINLRLSH